MGEGNQYRKHFKSSVFNLIFVQLLSAKRNQSVLNETESCKTLILSNIQLTFTCSNQQ